MKTTMVSSAPKKSASAKISAVQKKRETEKITSKGDGELLSKIQPKVYHRFKGLKAWGKLDQGESSPNFHYFQVV